MSRGKLVINENSNSRKLPSFKKPPLTEVVCSFRFKYLERLFAPFLGTYWEQIKGVYSAMEEKPPIASIATDGAEFGLQDDLELVLNPRIWFINPENNALIQVQRNRFIHNWRKKDEQAQYPRYRNVSAEFFARFEEFERFLKNFDIGSLDPLEYELTYVNHIPLGDCWDSLDDLSGVLKSFKAKSWKTEKLNELRGFSWTSNYELPDANGLLISKVQSAVRNSDKKKFLQFSIIARGIDKNRSVAQMKPWFDLAHEWIVDGFSDLTSDAIQDNVWVREK
ncbi:TIGR04255 family protein [bacterium]|nr:TIGR04255 family protein [bacterium]QQR56880.1 MAG: TIGR04255 family protein [Candidatus Melainabacteria bacterium]